MLGNCYAAIQPGKQVPHKFNLMRKLDLHNKAQLVRYAIQKKIIILTSPLAS